MRITPLEIKQYPFKKVFSGFDPDAVNTFKEMVASELEALIIQNNEYGIKLKQLEERIEGYQKIEKVLQDTLLTAQRATDEARVNAQREAELILKDATIRADRYEDEARRRVHTLESDIITLRNQRDSFLARFKAMLTTQLSLLDVITGELRNSTDRQPLDSQVIELTEEETLAEVPPQPNMSSFDS